MKKVWFTADTHFEHKNIIEYCQRPFKDTDEMDVALIYNWNNTVSERDDVYVVGDFAFKNHEENRSAGLLNGNKILVKGNHDDSHWQIHSLILEYYGMKVFVTHRPEDCVLGYKLCLCGHLHEKWRTMYDVANDRLFINVGVDQWGYKPVEFKTLYTLYISEIKQMREKVKT